MRSRMRRYRATLHYLRRPTREFLPVFLGMIAILIAGSISFHVLYVQRDLSYTQSLYLTYCLLFMEHLYELPQHWLLQAFYVILPPLGLVVVLDGIIRFSYHLLRRDDSSAEWVKAMSHTMKDHVVLFGLGKLGLRVLQELLKLGELVVAVEKDPLNPNLAFARKHGVPVRVATGREAGILEDLNLAGAKSLIMATDDDLANLEVAIDARKLRPEIRVVLRMFDQELAAKIKDAFDIQLAFSTSELAAPLFATASTDRRIVNSFYVGDNLILVASLEVAPDSPLIGMTVADLRTDHSAIVLDISRNEGHRYFPDSTEVISADDTLTVQALPDRLQTIEALNQPSST